MIGLTVLSLLRDASDGETAANNWRGNQERGRGLSLNDALISAGAIRFRPIVMTTLAMIFGMIPLAMAIGGGGAQRAPMAHAVIGGLISSTILTLIVVPVILSYTDSITRRLARLLPKAPDHQDCGTTAKAMATDAHPIDASRTALTN